MPTSYTSPIYNGDPITFAEFAMRCARQMGATIAMRDASLDAPIPERFEPSDWHLKELGTAKRELARLEAMSDIVADIRAVSEYEDHLDYVQETSAKRSALYLRYETMLACVETWVPPTTEHDGLKEFMRKQIQESMKWDCGWVPESKDRLSGERWREEKIERVRESIAYHEREYAAEVERVEERNRWLVELRRSLVVDAVDPMWGRRLAMDDIEQEG